MSKFTTSGVVVEEKKSSGSKYLSYGIQKAAIVGYEVKAASTGKQMVTLLMESPKVTDPGFEPDPNAVAQPIQLRSQQHQQSRKPRPGNAGGGNGGGKPAAKRGSPPKRSFNR